MSEDDESELIRGAMRGDRAAMDLLARNYLSHVSKFAILMGVKEPDELAQETVTEMMKSLGSFQGRAKFASWVMSIAVNMCRKWRREHRRRSLGASRETARRAIDPRNPSRSVLSTVVHRENLEKILGAFDCLPSAFREAFILKSVEGLDYREIGEATGTSEATARVRVHRAKMMLQCELGPGFATLMEQTAKPEKDAGS